MRLPGGNGRYSVISGALSAETRRPPLVRFKNAEDLRYQNDYFELPSPEDFDYQNEIFQDFEVPRLQPKKTEKRELVSPKSAKLLRFSEPLSYMNPLDTQHRQEDVETFPVSGGAGAAYSRLRASPHYVDTADTGPTVRARPAPTAPSRYQEFQQIVENEFLSGYEISKLEPGPSSQQPQPRYEEHVFRLTAGDQDSGHQAGHSSRAGEQHTGYNEDYNGYNEVDSGDYNGYNEVESNNFGDYEDNYIGYNEVDSGDYNGYSRDSYKDNYNGYNEVDSRDYTEDHYSDYSEAERPAAAMPAPLPPPPGIIEMQHDSVFAGNFDVPKLGAGGEYTPPELLYNQLVLRAQDTAGAQQPPARPAVFSSLVPAVRANSFSNLLPRTRSRALQAAPAQRRSSAPARDYFQPSSAPSLTFEPELSNEAGDRVEDRMEDRVEDRRLYEELHGGHAPAPALLSRLVEDSPDYSAFSRPAEPPSRPETLLPPAPSSYRSSGLGAELGAGRHKRYPSVDYAPQQDYSPAPVPVYPAEPFQPAPYQPRPTPQPAYLQHEPLQFPAPDNLLRDEPPPPQDYHSPDYYNYDHYSYPDYHSPSYNSYDTLDYVPIQQPAFMDIPKLVAGAEAGLGNYNQFVNVAGPDTFEHGHVRGNPEHSKQEYTRREGRHFKSQVMATQVAAAACILQSPDLDIFV